MAPNRETEPTPVADETPSAPLEPRAKRSTIGAAWRNLGVTILNGIAKRGDRLALAIVGLALAGVAVLQLRWTQRIDHTADDAQAVAGVAAAQSAAAAAPAAQATVVADSTFDAAKAINEAVTNLTAEINKLNAKVERLEAAREKRKPRKRTPIQPPPPLAATASKQATDPPAAPAPVTGDMP